MFMSHVLVKIATYTPPEHTMPFINNTWFYCGTSKLKHHVTFIYVITVLHVHYLTTGASMYRAEKLLYGCIWMHIIVVAIIVVLGYCTMRGIELETQWRCLIESSSACLLEINLQLRRHLIDLDAARCAAPSSERRA